MEQLRNMLETRQMTMDKEINDLRESLGREMVAVHEANSKLTAANEELTGLRTKVDIYLSAYTYAHGCMHRAPHKGGYIYKCIHIHTWLHAQGYIHARARAHTHTHTHTHNKGGGGGGVAKAGKERAGAPGSGEDVQDAGTHARTHTHSITHTHTHTHTHTGASDI